MLKKSDLRPSQRETADFILKNQACAVFSEMGFGKTVVSLTAMMESVEAGEINKILVASTVRVSRNTWPNEIQRWEHLKDLEPLVICGTETERVEKLKKDAILYTINMELFVWLVEHFKDDWPFDALIFDDAKGFKNQRKTGKPSSLCAYYKICPVYEPSITPKGNTSNRCAVMCSSFKPRARKLTRFGAVCRIRHKIKRLVHLTGTPSDRNLLDLWPMMYTIDGGKRLGRTYTWYRDRYFHPVNVYNWFLNSGSADTISSLIKDVCIALPSEIVLQGVTYRTAKIKLNDVATKMYSKLQRELLLETKNGSVEALNGGVLAGKLLQVCGGAVYTDKGEYSVIHNDKLDTLERILKDHKDEPVLVGYNFRHELIRLKERFPHGVDFKTFSDPEKEWNSGKHLLVFVHPESAGHGLNLQLGPGRVLVWFGLNWSLSLNKQLNKRLHRPGQQRETIIYYIVAESTIDKKVVEALHSKGVTQSFLLKSLVRDARESTNNLSFKSREYRLDFVV